MQAAADNAGAAEQKVNTSKQVEEIKAVTEDAISKPDEIVSNSAREQSEKPEVAVVNIKKEIDSKDLVEKPETGALEVKEMMNLVDQVEKPEVGITDIIEKIDFIDEVEKPEVAAVEIKEKIDCSSDGVEKAKEAIKAVGKQEGLYKLLLFLV